MEAQLTDKEKKLLFWASFLSLMAAGVGFSFRVLHGGTYGGELDLTNQQVGMIFGASLWPIAITMIGFSLVLDKTGFKKPMYVAFALQAGSAILTAMASSYAPLYFAALPAGLGHGIVEAVINPVCAAVYPKDKTLKLTILHAAWPAGLVAGGASIIISDGLVEGGLSWKIHALWMLVPVIAYAFMYAPCKFPVDERVKAGVPYIEMLREVGFLGAFLASFMIIYEIGNQSSAIRGFQLPEGWFYYSVAGGAVVGAVFGALVKAVGKPLFFFMCVLMIPIATAELATDGWISKLMKPVLADMKINPGFALVFSAFIMLFFRVFAGQILKLASPPAILAISGLFSAVGLFWLSEATGIAILLAFVLYAMGQTYYWPCVLGFVSERYPRGGALTLNTVSAIGLLSVGIIGGTLLGVAFDKSIHEGAKKELPQLTEFAKKDAGFLWMKHTAVDPAKKDIFIASKLSKADADAVFATAKGINAEKTKKAEEDLAEREKENAAKPEAEQRKNLKEAAAVRLATGLSEENQKKLTDALPEDTKASVSAVLAATGTYTKIDDAAGRDVLVYAARFPAILVLAFGAIALYFKAQGGYKPIDLDAVEEAAEL